MLTLKSNVTADVVRAELASEIRGAWSLYAAGIIREAYASESPTRVIFIMESDGATGAERHLAQLPLVAKGLFDVQLHELRPFVNWSALFSA